jgi:Spy/CpxP family protein refolding chaperone
MYLSGKALTILAVAAATSASAQTVKETLEVTRQAAETQRRVLVSGVLVMTDEEAKAFWPLYDAYEKERRPIDERANNLVADFVAAYQTMGDTQAKAMLQEELNIDVARLKLRQDFMARLGRVLSARQLVRFFQVQGKLDAVIRADISRQIPLVP